MKYALAERVSDLGGEAVLSDVQVLKLLEGLQVLEESANGLLILDNVALKGEAGHVLHVGQLLGQLHSGFAVEGLLADFKFVGTCGRLTFFVGADLRGSFAFCFFIFY